MATALVTVCVGEGYEEIGKLTHPTMKRYADRIGAEFVVIRERKFKLPYFEKFQLFDLMKDFQRVLYLDGDCLVREDTPNLFEVVPEEKFGIMNEGHFVDRTEPLRRSCKLYQTEIRDWKGEYYNTGVMVIPKRYRGIFSPPERENDDIETGFDQALINVRLLSQKVEVQDLEYRFNRISLVDSLTGEDRHASYILHYAGAPDTEERLRVVREDLAKWESGFRGRHHILMRVCGGMGDQICAEPVIRFLRERVHPEGEIIVLSDWPRIFQHLEGKWVDKNLYWQDFRPEFDTPYYKVETIPKPETHPLWQFVSHALCHGVDFVSISALRRTLPDSDKTIRLEVTKEDRDRLEKLAPGVDFKSLVAVHAGRHWPSKTFPAEWWLAVIEGIQREGLPVVLIGKDLGPTQGYVKMEAPKGVLDLRDVTDQGSFFALISQAKVLVSNDSSPIHIAGAFDNYIVLIPSVKHPDHVLPYRKGSKSYKAIALYKSLVADSFSSSPTAIQGETLEFPRGDISDSLPEPREVVEKVVEFYRSG